MNSMAKMAKTFLSRNKNEIFQYRFISVAVCGGAGSKGATGLGNNTIGLT
jgi:hypothetical protein